MCEDFRVVCDWQFEKMMEGVSSAGPCGVTKKALAEKDLFFPSVTWTLLVGFGFVS